jgi:hypothetical protein
VFLLFNNSQNLRKISVNNLVVKYRQNEDNAGVARRLTYHENKMELASPGMEIPVIINKLVHL